MIFKRSHARGNPAAVSPSTQSINSQNQNRVPNKIALSVKSVVSILNATKVHGWHISGQKPSTHHCSAPAAQYSSCSPHMAALHFPSGSEKYSRKEGSFTRGTKSWGAALGTAWAPWPRGRKAEPSSSLLPGLTLLRSPREAEAPQENGCKIEVLITTSKARGDKISLLLQLSSWHFPLCIFFDFACCVLFLCYI